ncbi:TPA: hypothetical protein ACH3X1_005624 [Trebouxia sp. C0004]
MLVQAQSPPVHLHQTVFGLQQSLAEVTSRSDPTCYQVCLVSIYKLVCCPDAILTHCGRILTIVWVNPAQKGLKLCFICKVSHAQNAAQSKCLWSIPQDFATCGSCLVGMYKWNSND